MDLLNPIRVTDVDYVRDYTMDLEFSNGERRRLDFLPLLRGRRFEELKEPGNFIQFGLTHWTLEWYNGVDFAPEYLYEQSAPLPPSVVDKSVTVE